MRSWPLGTGSGPDGNRYHDGCMLHSERSNYGTLWSWRVGCVCVHGSGMVEMEGYQLCVRFGGMGPSMWVWGSEVTDQLLLDFQ